MTREIPSVAAAKDVDGPRGNVAGRAGGNVAIGSEDPAPFRRRHASQVAGRLAAPPAEVHGPGHRVHAEFPGLRVGAHFLDEFPALVPVIGLSRGANRRFCLLLDFQPEMAVRLGRVPRVLKERPIGQLEGLERPAAPHTEHLVRDGLHGRRRHAVEEDGLDLDDGLAAGFRFLVFVTCRTRREHQF